MYMVSQDKLISNGIRYTDSLFEEISKRIEQGVRSSDTLESFLAKYNKAFPEKGNPLITLGYDKKMLDIILQETNNHKFSRPSQKEMVRVTIENKVGEKIVDVGDNITEDVRDIVKDGYDNNLSQDEIAENISAKVSSIKNKRARAIARTEVARAATISDYIINKEMGATHFYVECRNTACPVCKEAWHNKWTPENDSSFSPSDTSAGGKGWIGDKTYSMSDTKMLPPLHPNCRCVPYFINDGSALKPTAREPTKEELSTNLTASERAKYANYKRSIASHEQWLRDNPNASEKAISGHRKRLEDARRKLEELRVKAIGGVEAPVGQPAPEPKPEPKPTPKEQENPKPKETSNNDTLPTPTTKQLKENLTSDELKKYKRYQKEIREGKLSDAMIARRKQDLENLKRKALGLKPIVDTKKPKATPKPKTKNNPKPEQPNTENKTPTKEQINKNLTKKEQNEFKELNEVVNWANDILNKASSTDKQKTYAKKRLEAITPRFNELSNKALGLTPKRKRKSTKTSKTKKTKEPVQLDKPKNARLTKEECDSLTFEQLAEHHNAKYNGIVKLDDHDGKQYHVFEQTFDNGETFTLHFEKGAVASYRNGGVATANEIIHEVFKVPEILRKETNKIYFKNTQQGLQKTPKGKLKSIGKNVGGYNLSNKKSNYNTLKRFGRNPLFDPDHQIVINPKSFKKLNDFYDIITWRDRGDEKTSWKHIIHHEFTHSIDSSRDIWRNDKERLSSRKEYEEIEKAEPDFTDYAHQQIPEAFAEHGGYISYMLANPEEQSKTIEIIVFERDEQGRQKSFSSTKEKITFEEYKKRFPKHYEYFTNLLKDGVKE